jgi:hypothetical protein
LATPGKHSLHIPLGGILSPARPAVKFGESTGENASWGTRILVQIASLWAVWGNNPSLV